jgi:HK97 family phage prohead protease
VDTPKDETVEIRSSSITSVDTRQRIIDLIAVPWNQEADVLWRGEEWKEVFVPGAFDGIESHAGRIRVNREHLMGDTVGKVIQFENAADGLRAQVKIAETTRGDDTLALADEDMISASVGYRVKKPSDVQLNRRNRMRRVVRAFIDHLAMVEAPAYAGARVLAVRAEPSGLEVAEPLPLTPALDEAMNSEVLAWARARLSR